MNPKILFVGKIDTNVHESYASYTIFRVAGAFGVTQEILDAKPDLVVIDAFLPDESGFLLCAKLQLIPTVRQILVADDYTYRDEKFADFVGAERIVNYSELKDAIAEVLNGALLQAV